MAELVIYTLTKKLSEDELKEFREQKIETAATSVFNSIKSSIKNNYSQKKVKNLLINSDINKDGKITTAEAKSYDIDNILKLSSCTPDTELKNLQNKITKDQDLDGIKGIEKGLNAPGPAWLIARRCILKYCTKEDMIYMLQNKNVINFLEECLKDERKAEHFKDLLLNSYKMKPEEIKAYGFSEKTLKLIL